MSIEIKVHIKTYYLPENCVSLFIELPMHDQSYTPLVSGFADMEGGGNWLIVENSGNSFCKYKGWMVKRHMRHLLDVCFLNSVK